MCVDYKKTKWAQDILKLQNEDGTWGNQFHSLALPSKRYPLTTEQALRRMKILGFTIEDESIQRSVNCMVSCLRGERKIDDYFEKGHDWDLFTKLMLATWIREFDSDNEEAISFAKHWANVIEQAFVSGAYNHATYLSAYKNEFDSIPKGGRETDFVDFYHLNLIQVMLSEKTEECLLEYVINKPDGIYYIYSKPINRVPEAFASIETSRYLAAIEILSGFKPAKEKLRFVVTWLEKNRDANGQWDLGTKVKDGIYFPLSDLWRKEETRKADCTHRIESIIKKLR